MDANREAARAALRRAMEAEFAALPAEDTLDAPSPALEARMDALFAKEKRHVWSALSRKSRRVLVAAAIVAACLALVAWTPVGGMVVELMTTAYEEFMDYRPGPGLRTEIETVYAPLWLPEGFEEVSREMWEEYSLDIVYRNDMGEDLLFNQVAADSVNGLIDNENVDVRAENVGGMEVLLGVTEAGTVAVWTQDYYLMEIICRGSVEPTELKKIILSVIPEA